MRPARAHPWSSRLPACLAGLAALALAGCNAGGSGGPDAGPYYTCAVDPAALATPRSCLYDDGCPCGSYCKLAACASDCKATSDCTGGQVCDGFGRCVTRPPGNSAVVVAPPIDPSPQGTLTLTGAPVALDATHLLGQVGLTATNAAVGQVDVQAAAGVKIQCTPGGSFGSSCSIPSLARNATVSLAVRVTDTSVASAHEVKVTTRAQCLDFRVRYAPPPAATPPPLEGVYTGYAHPVAFGSVSRSSTTALPGTLTEVALPVNVTIHPEVVNARVVEMSDLLGLVFPERTTVGQLLRDTGTGNLQLNFPARPYVGAGVGGASDVDVSVAATSTAVEVGTAGLTVHFRARFSGVIDGPNDPYVTWLLTLGRVGDLPADAGVPAVPAAYAAADPAVRAGQPFTEETALEARLTELAAVAPATTERKVEALLCTPYDAPAPLYVAQALGSPWSGDLGCAGATGTTPLQTFGLLKDSLWQVATILTSCMADLNAGQAVASNAIAPGPGAGCIDVPRAVDAIRWGLDVDRRRALGEAVPSDATLSSLGHRSLQQWLGTHLFVARQATQVDLLNDVLASEGQINRGFRQLDMLGLMGRGFDLLLKPRVALGVSRLPPQVVFLPDYRPRLAPSLAVDANPRQDQWVGLPVTIVDSLQQAIGVYAALYERARYVPADRPALEASARDFMRKSLVLVALATQVNDVARANNPGNPTWDLLWQQKRGLYGVALAGLLRSVNDLREGKNPLDIDDQTDLPLYRVGAQVDPLARFSAVSDYLLGTGATLSSTAIVPARVLDATTALTAARAAWAANAQQSFAEAQITAGKNARLEGINRRYGEQIFSLCGDPSMNAATVLNTPAAIDADTCFIKPECRATPEQRRAVLAPGQVARLVCLAASVRELLGPTATEALATAFNPAQVQPILDGRATVRGHSESSGTVLVTLSDGSLVPVSSSVFVTDTSLPATGSVAQAQLDRLLSRCDAVRGASEAARPATAPASCTLNGDCPGGYACAGGTCVISSDPANQTACYTGSMGELAVASRAGAKDVELARSELAELSQTYDLQMKKCIAGDLGAQAEIDATARHNETMSKLASVKLAADIVTNVAEGVAGCMEAAGEDNKFGACAAVACGAQAVAAASKSVSDGMEFAMGEADRAHDLEIQQIQLETDKKACTIEAEMALVGTHSAVLRIERAMLEVSGQLVQMENQKAKLRTLVREGQEAVASETARTVPAMGLEYWLNDSVELYGRTFRAARRVTYLAALAVEYEYQLSTIEKQNVLAATKVADLVGVVTRLRNLVATGTVKGRAPASLHSVVSVRANLLQLADQTTLAAGWPSLTDAQRLQLLLSSPRFAVHDATGAYLGQELPFRVAPLAALKLGDSGGVTLLSSGDCSERVWSVNASLVGDSQLVLGDSSRTRVTLKKRNRFFSQWCKPVALGSPTWQQAATRPSRNLFLDPYSDYLPGGPGSSANPSPTIDASAEADAFTVARIAPVLNVSRADFEADQYFNGASQELAGRGLYGDYALFFPAEFLSSGGGTGLQLGHLTDVLLRFDYVSVAQN